MARTDGMGPGITPSGHQYAFGDAVRFCTIACEEWKRRAEQAGLTVEDLRRVNAQTGQVVAVDVGADLGLEALVMAALGFRVVSIEGRGSTAAKLRAQSEKMGFNSSLEVLHACACAESGGTVTLHLARDSSSTLESNVAVGTPAGWKRERGTIELSPCVAIDDAVAGLAFRWGPRAAGPAAVVALMKIDVQGAEPVALAGARRVLARDRPLLFYEDVLLNDTMKSGQLAALMGGQPYRNACTCASDCLCTPAALS